MNKSPDPTRIPTPSPGNSTFEEKKSHPWRLCPTGEYWRRTHPRTVPMTARHPNGMTIVRGHCVKNPGGKEIFEPDEFREIANRYFNSLREDPKVLPGTDGFEFIERLTASTVRIVGMQPDDPEIRMHGDLPRGTPGRFGKLMKSVFWYFVRLQTGNGCKAYFEEDCVLPENYCGGISPD